MRFGTGCVTIHEIPRRAYPITIRYDVEPRLIGVDGRDAVESIQRDFTRIRALGFDGVMLRFVEDAQREELLDLAQAAKLSAAVPDRGVQFHLMTGSFPIGITDSGGLARAIPARIRHHAAFAGLVVDSGRTVASASRTAAVAAEFERRGIRCWLLAADPVTNPIRRSARVVTSAVDPSPRVALLAQYHLDLSLGRTIGLVVDRFDRFTGEPEGIPMSAGPLAPVPASALASLLARARQWGPRLAGLDATPLPAGAAGDAPGVLLTSLADARRRYLLLSNPNRRRTVRGVVVVPDPIGGRPVTRAVEVAPDSDGLPGVFPDSNRGSIHIDVNLRPGDARLFEIF